MKFKKGEIEAQSVLYVLSLIIVAFILLFGVRSIMTLNDTTTDISTVKFKSSLEKTVNYVKGSTGTIKQEEYYVPGSFTQICFVDDSMFGDESFVFGGQFLVQDSVQSGAQENVFLIGEKVLEDSFYIEGIEVNSGPNKYRCMDITRNNVYIRFEGKGNSVEILCPVGDSVSTCING